MLHSGRFNDRARFPGGGVHGLRLQRASLVAGLLNFLAALDELLSFLRGHWLQPNRRILTFGELVDGCGHHHAIFFGLRCGWTHAALSGPGAWRPGAFVIAAILVGDFRATLPLPVLAVLPALMGIDRIVAMASGLE